jgi:hypothetical protein
VKNDHSNRKRDDDSSQLSLDLDTRKEQQPSPKRPADVVSISKSRASAVRDVLIGDLISSKVPKKS